MLSLLSALSAPSHGHRKLSWYNNTHHRGDSNDSKRRCQDWFGMAVWHQLAGAALSCVLALQRSSVLKMMSMMAPTSALD